ncbi:ABC transporter ATP-binding protein [Bacillus sp. FJAT-29814]|uniref:ABC transporter ATP-binding protein n=1 Tax=Bacillus sp. FJAT-29814 TaxID=1729688 RepID=UPI0008348860|nr:dipeptide ABC transporter ATP-binding protein [Bacillus sp. FJAT-29814]
MKSNTLLEVKNLKKYFPIKDKGMFSTQKHFVQAVNDVSFTINEGETFGLVGESGCGKSTLARLIMGLIKADSGEINFQGRNFLQLRGKELRQNRKHMQMVFQKPYESLNPKMTVGEIISAPFEIHGIYDKKERVQKVNELLEMVGLSQQYINRYPHEFSGGQRQRIGIARAIALHPKLVICDEAVSALDVSIQSQILNLLNDLQKEFKLTYLFISHDLSVVKHVSDKIGVMYLGEMVEVGEAETIYKNPRHPYTQALLSAIPIPDPTYKKEQIVLEGDLPSPVNPPSGCRLSSRCPYAMAICKEVKPEFMSVGANHSAACHLFAESKIQKIN